MMLRYLNHIPSVRDEGEVTTRGPPDGSERLTHPLELRGGPRQ